MKFLLVTGGRDYMNLAHLEKVLQEIDPDVVMEGGATGADAAARHWARNTGRFGVLVPANWETIKRARRASDCPCRAKRQHAHHGKGAGPRRNELRAPKATSTSLAGKSGAAARYHMVQMISALRRAGHEVSAVAFPGGRGTASCVKFAEEAAIVVRNEKL